MVPLPERDQPVEADVELAGFDVIAGLPGGDAGKVLGRLVVPASTDGKQPEVEVNVCRGRSTGVEALERLVSDSLDLIPVPCQQPRHHQVAEADGLDGPVAELTSGGQRRLALLDCIGHVPLDAEIGGISVYGRPNREPELLADLDRAVVEGPSLLVATEVDRARSLQIEEATDQLRHLECLSRRQSTLDHLAGFIGVSGEQERSTELAEQHRSLGVDSVVVQGVGHHAHSNDRFLVSPESPQREADRSFETLRLVRPGGGDESVPRLLEQSERHLMAPGELRHLRGGTDQLRAFRLVGKADRRPQRPLRGIGRTDGRRSPGCCSEAPSASSSAAGRRERPGRPRADASAIISATSSPSFGNEDDEMIGGREVPGSPLPLGDHLVSDRPEDSLREGELTALG